MSPDDSQRPDESTGRTAPEREAGKYESDEHEVDQDLVQDDQVIGRAFVRSLQVIGGVALLVAIVLWVRSRPEEEGPEKAIEAAAPEEVVRRTEAPDVRWTDVTAEARVTFVHENGAYGDKLLPETMGGGVAFFDYDNDGDPDLLLVSSAPWPFAPDTYRPSGSPTTVLYENDGEGRFTDVTQRAGLDISLYGMGAAVGDFDGDGWTDLYLTAVGGNRLFANREGRFVDVTEGAGVAGADDSWSTGAAFLDYDRDGHLDLFVANYVRWSREIDFQLDFRLDGVGRAYGPPQSYAGTYPYLFRNRGDGSFEDVTQEAGVAVDNPVTDQPMAKGLGVMPVDTDGDGWLDILVANDTVQNFFFHNRGDGSFEEVGEYYGLAFDREGNATGAMGVDAGYFRDDGNLGFVIGNFANEMSSIYVAQDDPTFYVDESISEGIGAPSRRALSFGAFFFDYDLDGRLDLLQVNGHLEESIATVDPSQSYRQAPQLFWNAGSASGPTYIEVPTERLYDLGQPLVGRGAAYADIDGDGDLDLALTQAGGPARLLRNDQQTGHRWIRPDPNEVRPDARHLGGWLHVRGPGFEFKRPLSPTRSYLSQVELAAPVGIGSAEGTVEVEVVTMEAE